MKIRTLLPLALGLALASTGCSRMSTGGVNSATGAPVSAQSIELIDNGFSIGSRGLHHADAINFGEPRAQVLAQLRPVLGAPTGRGRNAECPTGAVDWVQYESLNLNFQNGRFVGWVLDGPRPALEDYHGLSVGTPRSGLADELAPDSVETTSLGTEANWGEMGGLLDGAGPNARLTTLFAGVTCFAR